MFRFTRRLLQKVTRSFPLPWLLKKNFEPNKFYFSEIYEKKSFGASESASGPGSSIGATLNVSQELPRLLREFEIESIADMPCGDLTWLGRIDLNQVSYTGLDIVPEMIAKLKFQYPGYAFFTHDATSDSLGEYDLVMCSDLLVHLTNQQAVNVLSQIKKSKSKFLLSTTFLNLTTNKELAVPKFGVGWRPLNLELAPFNLGKPIKVIHEGSTEGRGRYSDKSLALWQIN